MTARNSQVSQQVMPYSRAVRPQMLYVAKAWECEHGPMIIVKPPSWSKPPQQRERHKTLLVRLLDLTDEAHYGFLEVSVGKASRAINSARELVNGAIKFFQS